jgi:hypothetical protein
MENMYDTLSHQTNLEIFVNILYTQLRNNPVYFLLTTFTTYIHPPPKTQSMSHPSPAHTHTHTYTHTYTYINRDQLEMDGSSNTSSHNIYIHAHTHELFVWSHYFSKRFTACRTLPCSKSLGQLLFFSHSSKRFTPG